ncbi:MAG: alpha/beta hydrolase, partial [Patescibacteria group bacterium]
MSSVSAEVKSPYVVDEKTQVLFGDSAFISATSTYQGLENYTVNYVNHYLRITFTYTHERRSFASYPPFLYITASDPRATSTPTVRFSPNALFLLGPIPIPPGHETDWYSYDAQFDATGYTVVVKEAGETEITNSHTDIEGIASGDWAALANRYTLAIPPTAYSMSFTPVPIYNAPEPEAPPAATTTVATTTPVIIVPGIMGSYLNKEDDTEVWMNLFKMVLPGDEYLDDLKLSESGLSSVVLEATEIVKSVNVPLFQRDNFLGLINEFSDLNYVENEILFTFPYDWRLDIESSSSNLKNKINQIKSEFGVEKVDLVAHSMGGLLVKKYLKDYGGDSVEKFIDIGTPHTGSPESFKILSFGETGIAILNREKIKEISQNMPSVYQLLPSRNYFNDSDSNYKYYVFDAVNGSDRLTFDQTTSYLKSAGRNSTLVDRADAFHQEIDNLNPADYGVETYNFVGCGTPTVGQFYILDNTDGHYIYNIKMINGDGTVPLKSAEAISATKTYYVKNAQHALMPSTSGVKELIAEILTATSTTDFDISTYSNLATNSGNCAIPNGRIVSFHSPIELHIYDSSGNHTGPDANGD